MVRVLFRSPSGCMKKRADCVARRQGRAVHKIKSSFRAFGTPATARVSGIRLLFGLCRLARSMFRVVVARVADQYCLLLDAMILLPSC
jgi:hypothetical protein